MSHYNVKKLEMKGDRQGRLIALEAKRDVSFDIKRVYYIFGTENGVARGFHAHRELEQFLICVSGSCSIVMDDGSTRDSVLLDSPDKGLYIGPMKWHEMHELTTSTVLLVLASDWYRESDYIRDYGQFFALAEKQKSEAERC